MLCQLFKFNEVASDGRWFQQDGVVFENVAIKGEINY